MTCVWYFVRDDRRDCINGSEVLVEQYGDPCVARAWSFAVERGGAFVQPPHTRAALA
jgi:hypothetical protein